MRLSILLLVLSACDVTTESIQLEPWDGDEIATPAKPADDDGDGYSVETGDCDDSRVEVHPGAPERCNGLDDNCEGAIDEGVMPTWYMDDDSDGYGATASGVLACAAPEGHVPAPGDCNDGDSAFHPGADESSCDGEMDFNCDGSVGRVDEDRDGIVACEDCDDRQIDVHPGATESCNGRDDDCDGSIDLGAIDPTTWYVDIDADGWGDAAWSLESCYPPAGFSPYPLDCDDEDPTLYPLAPELCDGVDQDCDGVVDDEPVDADLWYLDLDGDGWGRTDNAAMACMAPDGRVARADDCDDARARINPGMVEDCDDPADHNCDGSVGYADLDADGFAACDDYDDTTAAVH